MDPATFLTIITGLASAVATLAGLLYRKEVARAAKLERQVEELVAIIVSRSAQTDETMREYADYLKRRSYERGN